ncbi:MAG: ADP-ribosylglycohydrolase family protein [Chloroflexi bacterium]|nr:ADP-ribosylglycohydrolase family protein [Chloroflexota bacterium]
MSLPNDYAERVYAGVLGKIIGVYLGRPFEGWSYERILEELGEIDYYVNDRIPWDHPLVVTDDDITGTFTFLRALADYGNSLDLSPAQIGQTWLNYIIEERTILWWGGFGNSTEHTAFIRLKNGSKAPESGSVEMNGAIIAEQIGAQIFIDGWAMVAPGNPDLAADLAKRAASVSHDGEAIYASQVLAAMEAQAFVEPDINKLLDVSLSFIPKDSVIYKMISDIRGWHAAEPDWHKGREKIASLYNYENYGGNCHMVPNHGLIILGLLYGDSDFNKSMLVVNTAGWDTDCNSGNLGCLLGIKDGLATFDNGKDWRGPVADRLYMPTADGDRSITDAVIETQHVVNMGRALVGEEPIAPKNGARFHFEASGSVQGFRAGEESSKLVNAVGHSEKGERSLALSFKGEGSASTPTFILPDELNMEGYKFLASPTLYSGQKVIAGFSAEQATNVKLFIKVYNKEDKLDLIYGSEVTLTSGVFIETEWQVPNTHSQPIAEVGFECKGESGIVYLDYLTWEGEPNVILTRPIGADQPGEPPQVWRQAWVNGMDLWEKWWQEPYRLVQNGGRGLIMQGNREWKDYEVETAITPWLMEAGGVGARVQGMKRYYSLQLEKGNKVRLVKALDGDTILGEKDFNWEIHNSYTLKMQVSGNRIKAWVDGQLQFDVVDEDKPLCGGGVAYVVDLGHISSQAMIVKPITE